jgi:phage baseplate assembly protein V
MINMTDVQRLIQKMTAPMQRRVRLMVARAIVELVDDSKKMQTLQVSIHADELRDDVERYQPYGLTAAPEAGAEAIVVMVGGNADHPVAVVVDDRRYRPLDLEEGEVALYTKQDGKRVHCKEDGGVDLGTEPTDYVALKALVEGQLTDLKTAISNAVVVAQDGGASFKSTLVTALAAWPGNTGATEVKAK